MRRKERFGSLYSLHLTGNLQVAMIPLVFLLSTTLFLSAGFYILGERRLTMLLGVSSAFSLVFYLLMTQALGLYLSPGFWWGA